MIDVEYVFQEREYLPEGFSLPENRVKPWGTGHAILCAKDAIKKPFLVINADDYYGQSVYKAMYDAMQDKSSMYLAGYQLGNTLSENGTVSRGVCTVEDGYLVDIVEKTDVSKDSGIPLNTPVSMNMWGLDTDIFPYLEKEFVSFLKEHINEEKSEFLLPTIINKRMRDQNMKVKVIPTAEQWHGVTYAADTDAVRAAISKIIETGIYNG